MWLNNKLFLLNGVTFVFAIHMSLALYYLYLDLLGNSSDDDLQLYFVARLFRVLFKT